MTTASDPVRAARRAGRSIARALAALAVLAAGAAALGERDGAVVTPAALDNGQVKLDFTTSGTSLELATVTNLLLDGPGGRPMDLAPKSGSWTIVLAMKGGIPGVNSPFVQRFEFDMDGTKRWNTNVWPGGSPPFSLALSLDSVVEDAGTLPAPNTVARWSGAVTLTSTATAYPFEIETDWTLVPGKPFVETRIAVDFNPNGLEPAPDLPFYLAWVVYPTVHVMSLNTPQTPDDALVVPWQIGTLIEDPTNADVVDGQVLLPFPKFLNFGTNLFPIRVAGYYDGAPESSCFFYAANDCDAYWKELWIGTGPSLPNNNCALIGDAGDAAGAGVGSRDARGARRAGGGDRGDAGDAGDGGASRYVTFRFQHFRDDIYSSSPWVLPYAVRLGTIEGDWWELAQAYRELMIEQGVPWYQGPVGSDSHPMPQVAKDLVGQVILQPGHTGDHMDYLARQTAEVVRVMGPDTSTIWYQGHSPDRFNYWYYGDGTPGNTGYLPGRPSLASAVREGGKQFSHLVTPYAHGSAAVDCTDPAASGCFDDLADANAAFLLREDLAPFYLPSGSDLLLPPRRGFLCPGSSWWQAELPSNLADIVAFTGAGGLHVDYFLTGICYSDAHHHALPGDPPGAPGGGDWMYTTRVRQLQDLEDVVGEDLVVSMEYTLGRFAEVVDIMHFDPAHNIMAAEVYQQIDCTAPPVAKPMDNAVTIPFFRAVYDNVKFGTVETRHPEEPDRRAWIVASLVFTFGSIPGLTQAVIEEIPVFSLRVLYSPFYRFLGDMTAVLREGGLLTWHNGTLRRLPGYTVQPNAFTADPGTAIPGVEHHVFLDCGSVAGLPAGYQEETPLYTEERTGCNTFTPETFLTPGMFQAPDDAAGTVGSGGGTWADAGSLAFVLANPWIAPDNPGAFVVSEIQFEPARYPGWTDATVYSVHEQRLGEPAVVVAEGQTGPLDFAPDDGAMPPGDIAWWIFRKEAPGSR